MGIRRMLFALLFIAAITAYGYKIPKVPKVSTPVPTINPELLRTVKPLNKTEAMAAAKNIQKNINLAMQSDYFGGQAAVDCRLYPTKPNLFREIRRALLRAKLLTYIITIANHTDNPLLDSQWTFEGNQWSRVAHAHGQTILSLAFNYGILSLMTLSFGIEGMNVELKEEPYNCLRQLTEAERVKVVLEIMLRDFKEYGDILVKAGESVCHQVIKNEDGFAKFTDQCCYQELATDQIVCKIDIPNMWLNVLEALMAIFALLVFLFGPLFCIGLFYSQTLETVKYVVNLKEPLYKTLRVCHEEANPHDVMADRILDLRNKKHFKSCKELCQKLPTDTLIPIKISQFNIWVNYLKLQPETSVPVGVIQSLSRSIFFCKLNEIEAFRDCCEANFCGCLVLDSHPKPWQTFCNLIGRIILVVFIPVPYYIRLALYYTFEDPEVQKRNLAASNIDLPVIFDYHVLQYLTPTHPILIVVYLIYYITGLGLAIASSFKASNKFQSVIIDSMKDLMNMSWIGAVEMAVKNLLWPFTKFGVWGFFLGLLYWPLVTPLCLLAIIFFCVPIIFVSSRLIAHALDISTKREAAQEQKLPGELQTKMTGVELMEADTLLTNINSLACLNNRITNKLQRVGLRKSILNVSLAVICIASLMSIMILMAESLSLLLQILVFTMMGIIVNAGQVLKYGSLIFLVVIYSYDSYNNVYKQYLKLNKALFKEIKSRIKDIMAVTSLPSYLQENVGFKAAEASEQADYEGVDDFSDELQNSMKINDLILFIDNDDVPRIPKKLFEDTCEIRVPGTPGPVYISLLKATGRFCIIMLFILFVFMVVLCFGDVYKMSGTNQMLATLAGGFMPFIFSQLFKASGDDVEVGTLSFISKLEEVIINFWQVWPMSDLKFEISEKPEEEGDESDSDGESCKSEKGRDKKEKKDRDDSSQKGDSDLTEEELLLKIHGLGSARSAKGQWADVLIIVNKAEDLSSDDDDEDDNPPASMANGAHTLGMMTLKA